MSDTALIPNESSGLSLLSLSAAAASAAPIPLSPPSGPTTGITLGGSGSLTGNGLAGPNGTHPSASGGGVIKHRRLSSTGKARRRLSDARDAATRPSATSLQTAAAALSSLATLSLSSSPPLSHSQISQSFTSASNLIAAPLAIPIPASRSTSAHTDSMSKSVPLDDGAGYSSQNGGNSYTNDSSLTKGGKKRGTIFTCESCSKVYRHPSCLIKHRWEHSPQWREASKFVLSKHQQVQLLEAAAILSHLSPDSTGTSLPEDRSLWPSFLSGGALPPPSKSNMENSSTSAFPSQPTSSSVPATSFMNGANHAPSAGPRMHDYSLPPSANGTSGITQLRPGLLGVLTGPVDSVSHSTDAPATPGSLPVPVPKSDAYHHRTYDSISGKSEPWGSPASSHYAHHSYQPHAVSSHSLSKSYTQSDGTGGWSLPRSSVRSMSRSSRSRSPSASASGSKSDDENELVDVEDHDVFPNGRYTVRTRGRSDAQYGWKREDDDMSLGFSVQEEDEEDEEPRRGGKEMEEEGEMWDGMDMDMVMD